MADQAESSQNIEGTVVISNVVAGTTSRIGTILNVDKGTITRIEGGSLVITGGTTNITTGSIVVTVGTITAGTFRQQFQPVNQVTSYGTLATAAGSAFGTISGTSGAGTKHIVSGLSIVVNTGTADVRLLIGSAITGGSVLAAGAFVPSAGIVRDFNPPIESGTNSELIYHFVGAGTAFITVQYWKNTI